MTGLEAQKRLRDARAALLQATGLLFNEIQNDHGTAASINQCLNAVAQTQQEWNVALAMIPLFIMTDERQPVYGFAVPELESATIE